MMRIRSKRKVIKKMLPEVAGVTKLQTGGVRVTKRLTQHNGL